MENPTNAELLKFIKQNVATKEDLKGFATKKDLQELGAGLRIEIASAVDGLRDDFRSEITEAKSEILTSIDGYKKKLDVLDIEHKTLENRQDRRDRVFAKALGLDLAEIDSEG